jgi:hypothetical protein
VNQLYPIPTASLLLALTAAACAHGAGPSSAGQPIVAERPAPAPLLLPEVPPLPMPAPGVGPDKPPRLAVRARISSADDGRLRIRLAERARAALDGHPDVTTDLDEARLLGVPVVSLDAAAHCDYRRRRGHSEIECGLRFAVSNNRSRLLSTWRRSLSLTGAVDDSRDMLVDAALEYAVRELPDKLLRSLDRTL